MIKTIFFYSVNLLGDFFPTPVFFPKLVNVKNNAFMIN